MDTVERVKSDVRITKFGSISTHLALSSNQVLLDLLATADNPGRSIGGVTHTLDLMGTKVFVKKN